METNHRLLSLEELVKWDRPVASISANLERVWDEEGKKNGDGEG
jgi:hypothetical protein